jgi:ABC-type branched-subunit amino acid transport system ATPase component
MTAALAIANMSSGYGGSIVVNDVSLSVAPAQIMAVVGKNGMGKTRC